MGWENIINSISIALGEADLHWLLRPEVLTAVLLTYILVMRKRGALRALLFVVPYLFGMLIVWGKAKSTLGLPMHSCYFIAVLCMGSLLVLYIVYLYTFHEQVE